MSILSQPSLFSWKIVDRSPEIFRLGRILDALPDEALVAALRQARKGRRDDYPVEAVWRSFVAGVVLGHPTVAALIRELKRNGELREVCGFDPLRGDQAVPPEWVCSRLGSKPDKPKTSGASCEPPESRLPDGPYNLLDCSPSVPRRTDPHVHRTASSDPKPTWTGASRPSHGFPEHKKARPLRDPRTPPAQASFTKAPFARPSLASAVVAGDVSFLQGAEAVRSCWRVPGVNATTTTRRDQTSMCAHRPPRGGFAEDYVVSQPPASKQSQ